MLKISFRRDKILAARSFNFIKRTFAALVFITFGFSNTTIAQVAPDYQIGIWSQFKQAAVSYTFDDNTSKQLTAALPLFDQYCYEITLLKESQSAINANIPNAKCVTLANPSCVRGDLATIEKYYIAGRVWSNALEPGTPFRKRSLSPGRDSYC